MRVERRGIKKSFEFQERKALIYFIVVDRRAGAAMREFTFLTGVWMYGLRDR